MTTIKRRKLQPTPSKAPNKHLILLFKILLILIILLLLPQLVESKNRKRRRKQKVVNRKYNEVRSNCERSELCSQLNPAESEMCITKCMNIDCHLSIYGNGQEGGDHHEGGLSGELEPGEVDEERENQFEYCVREHLKKVISSKK